MDTCSRILLPYGLSSQYQSYLAGNDDSRTQCGPPRFRTASLLELAKLNPLITHKSLSALGSVTKRRQRTRSTNTVSPHLQQDKMGFQRNIKKINMGPATGKEKRGRARRKPQLFVRKIPQPGSKDDRNTRIDASQESPITLDSDDDAPESTPLRPTRGQTDISLIIPNLRGFLCDPQESPRNQNTQSGSVRAPLENTYAPTGFVLRRSSSAFTSDTRHQEKASSKGNTKTHNLVGTFAYQDASSDAIQSPLSHEQAAAMRKPAMRRKRHQCSSPPAAEDGNVKMQGAGIDTRSSNASPYGRSTAMADAKTSRMPIYIKPDTPTSWATQSENKRPRECKPGAISMSLLDIDDFGMRSKVAQLMAVAPALAVIDLYHLIIDSEGDLPRARKQAIKMSEAPVLQYRPGVDTDGDEIMVKIDPNDPAFEWDDDEPQPELDATKAARPSKPTPKAKSKQSSKATRSRGLQNSVRLAKSTKSNTKHRSNIGAKRTTSAFTNPTHARETSSDRDFVVQDFVVHYDLNSDVSNDSNHSISTDVHNRRVDSDTEISDVDDELDLDIDMQPRFAYNAGLLGNFKRSGKI